MKGRIRPQWKSKLLNLEDSEKVQEEGQLQHARHLELLCSHPFTSQGPAYEFTCKASSMAETEGKASDLVMHCGASETEAGSQPWHLRTWRSNGLWSNALRSHHRGGRANVTQKVSECVDSSGLTHSCHLRNVAKWKRAKLAGRTLGWMFLRGSFISVQQEQQFCLLGRAKEAVSL